jgi:hypothetical protein
LRCRIFEVPSPVCFVRFTSLVVAVFFLSITISLRNLDFQTRSRGTSLRPARDSNDVTNQILTIGSRRIVSVRIREQLHSSKAE